MLGELRPCSIALQNVVYLSVKVIPPDKRVQSMSVLTWSADFDGGGGYGVPGDIPALDEMVEYTEWRAVDVVDFF
jgi:hypothetical protein